MRRPNYGTVTGVTVTLAAVCAVRNVFLPLIPPPNPEIAVWGRGEFVQRASDQPIEWRPIGKEAFEEARTLSRPLVVVIGVPWSGVGRQADEAFAQPDVARALNRGFVPVRIDAAQDPRWLSQFLPLQRTRTGFSVGFQAWVFDLRHRLVGFVARVDSRDQLRETAVLDALLKAKAEFSDAALADDPPPLQLAQDSDRAHLLQPTLATLNLPLAAPTLAQGLDPEWGGWSVRGLFVGRPLAVRFLQLAGRWDDAGVSLRRTVLSPRADWLDGGFYRIARTGLRLPEYDKPVVVNAQTAEALAIQDLVRPDPVLRHAARATVAWLLGLRGEDALVPSAEEGDEDARGRSRRAGLSPSRLRDSTAWAALPPATRDWATDALGLDGPGATVLPTARAVADPRFPVVLRALREAAGPRRSVVAEGLCDANGTVAACLLRLARLWGDRTLAAAGGGMVDRMERFRTPFGVRHALNDRLGVSLYLGDALAYADARLEDFLTNGRAPSLEEGATVLRDALRTFEGATPGVLRPSPPGTELLPGVDELPQATDDEREALSATALRLFDAYATVLGPEEREFARAARDVDRHLGGVVDAVPAMGGILGALARHLDSGAAFVVGPDAAAQAFLLSRRLPGRLVTPVLGAARPDLRARPPGVYVSTRGGALGPLDEATLRRRLPPTLRFSG